MAQAQLPDTKYRDTTTCFSPDVGASYVLVLPKLAGPIHPPCGGFMGRFFKTGKDLKMFEKPKNNKGGRPPKEVKRLRTLSVKCSFFEGMQIENKAKQVGLSVSEYLREMGLKGAIKFRVKTLHREVLQLTGTLNHIAANLNQIAKKRNSFDELSVLERARLNQQSTSLQQVVTDIKSYLQ